MAVAANERVGLSPETATGPQGDERRHVVRRNRGAHRAGTGRHLRVVQYADDGRELNGGPESDGGLEADPGRWSGVVRRPDVVRRAGEHRVRRIGEVDRRRPARLVAASARRSAIFCAPRVSVRSIGWLVLAAVLTFVVVLGLGWASGGQDSAAIPDRTVLVQVHQGETLWTVAHRMAPSASPAAVVDRIRRLNGLDTSSVLFPGQLLQVPSGLTGAAEAKAHVVKR